MGNSNSSENNGSSQKGHMTGRPDGLKQPKILELDSFSISCITGWLLGPETVRLLFTGDRHLRKMLFQGGVSDFKATPRFSSLDTEQLLFWSSLSAYTGLRRLKLEKNRYDMTERTVKAAYLAHLPSSLRSLEIYFHLDFTGSEPNRLPLNLENLQVLSCQDLILPSNTKFELPRTLQKLSCGCRPSFCLLVLPPELKWFEPHMKIHDPIMQSAEFTLPSYLEKLAWPDFSTLLRHEPIPITLKSLSIHSPSLLPPHSDQQNAASRYSGVQIPSSLTELHFGPFQPNVSIVSIVQSLPRTLLSLVFTTREHFRPLGKTIIGAMPPNLTRLKCIAEDLQTACVVIKPDALASLPKSLISLCISHRYLEMSSSDGKVLSENELQALPPSLATFRMPFTLVKDVTLLSSALLRLECALETTQLNQLPPTLSWLSCVLHRDRTCKKAPAIRFPDSLTYLKTNIEIQVIQGVPKWPRYVQTLKCTFFGSADSIWSPDWAPTLPKSLVRLELDGSMPISNGLLSTLDSDHKNLTHLRLANCSVYDGSVMTLNANGIGRLPRSLLHADIYIVDKLEVKHLRNLPRDLQYLSIYLVTGGVLKIGNPLDFFKSLPKSICTLRLPVVLPNSNILQAAEKVGITISSNFSPEEF